MMHPHKNAMVLYAIMAVYGGSLFLPGLVLTNEVGQAMTQYGFQILFLGWAGIFSGVFSWYGYILGIVAFIGLKTGKISFSLISAYIGFLLALQALYLQYMNAQINFLDSYNSWDKGMGELSIGYYLWLLAFVLLIVFVTREKKMVQAPFQEGVE